MPRKNNGVKYRAILSLDGGGIRGLISARILQELEKITKKPIHKLFDLIVGTSTGGILAAGLARQPKAGGNKFGPMPAESLVDFYSEHGHEIFKRSLWRRLTSLDGLIDEKYDAKPLENILKKKFGNTELKDTKPDIILTSYNIEKRKPYLFKTSKARAAEKSRNHLLRHAARATSAAPTFFEPFLLDKKQWTDEKNRRVLVDGGVFANNPSMIALSEALSVGATLPSDTEKDGILLCAIGTGENYRAIPYKEAKDWGLAEWAKPVISVIMDGVSDSAHHLTQQLLNSGSRQRYFRFDICLRQASDDIDNVSRANIQALLSEAEKIIKEQNEELKNLADMLLKEG